MTRWSALPDESRLPRHLAAWSRSARRSIEPHRRLACQVERSDVSGLGQLQTQVQQVKVESSSSRDRPASPNGMRLMIDLGPTQG